MEIKKYSSHFLREDRAGVHSDMLLVVRIEILHEDNKKDK